jgi:hypothetical protein
MPLLFPKSKTNGCDLSPNSTFNSGTPPVIKVKLKRFVSDSLNYLSIFFG